MRRPIAARDSSWAHQVARFLARCGVRPNTVSIFSVVFALFTMLCLMRVPYTTGVAKFGLFCGAALGIQLRLLCNLFDGMLAVEFKQGSRLGAIFNDFPDRPADVLILVGCGYSGGPAWMPLIGWIAASLALLTAYTRVLGVAIGAGEYFTGPMAKQHRMAVATIACLLSAFEAALGQPPRVMLVALCVIVLGCIFTTVKRLNFIARDLNRAGASKDGVETSL